MTVGAHTPRSTDRVLHFVVAILFGLFYAYDLFEALANLVAVPAQLAEYNTFLIDNGLTPLAVPWSILVANLLVPLVAFAVAWWMGRRRSILSQIVLYVAGLAVVAALTLTLAALIG